MSEASQAAPPPKSPIHTARLYVLAAALMWSTAGLFAKAPLFDVWPEEVRGTLLSFWRALFAGVLLLPSVRRPRWRPQLAPLGFSFIGMNVTYLSAMSLTTAANAIWLQYTSPFWVFVLGAIFWRTPLARRDRRPLLLAAIGVALILYFELGGKAHVPEGDSSNRMGIACGLAAGVFYAGVVMGMHALKEENAVWLVAFCHLVTALALSPLVLYVGMRPTINQLLVLAIFGLFQMGLPYLLLVRGLQSVTPQEASLIALCEPVLVPLWVWLAWSYLPDWWTIVGGACILAGLLLRYRRPTRVS